MQVELLNPQSQERIRLKSFPILIGRDPEADVQVTGGEVAPFQCMLGRGHDGSLTVWALRTDVRTLVNGTATHKAVLASGDELTIGATCFVVDFAVAEPCERPPHGRRPIAVP